MHLKRQEAGKFWPVPRKGTKYLAVSTHNQKQSIPLVVVMRDILKLVKTKKELKKILNERLIEINGKKIRETNYPVGLFDILSLSKFGKNYRASLSEHKKMIFEEVSGKDAETKVIKIIGKKVLKKNKLQVNLMDGRNLIFDEKANIGDSIVYNFKENKIEKIIKMEKGKKGFVIRGKHAGKFGEISDIIERGGKKLAKIIIKDGKTEKINVWVKNVVAME